MRQRQTHRETENNTLRYTHLPSLDKGGIKVCQKRKPESERHESPFPSEDLCTYRHIFSHKYTVTHTHTTAADDGAKWVFFFCSVMEVKTQHLFSKKSHSELRLFVNLSPGLVSGIRPEG